jgi:hypothetical protein
MSHTELGSGAERDFVDKLAYASTTKNCANQKQLQ